MNKKTHSKFLQMRAKERKLSASRYFRSIQGRFRETFSKSSRMAPPKVGAPSWVARKTCSSTRLPQDTTTEGVNNHQEGVVYVGSIPSPVIKPVIPTLVEEHQVLMT
jgi:hypothetical protein